MRRFLKSSFKIPSFRVPMKSGRGNLFNRLPRLLQNVLVSRSKLLHRRTMTIVAVFVFGIFVSLPTAVQAKRTLPALKSVSASKSTSSGVTVKVKFRSDRKGVILNFGNLTAATGVSYDLIYDTRGTTQNAGGAVKISSDTANTEVIFGTCSSGVCRYDTGISNAKLQVFITLKNGRKIVKPFRLKV